MTAGRRLLMDPARPAVALIARQLDDPADALPLVVSTLHSHRELILNYFRAKKQFSSGVVEGRNNKVKVTTRRSGGVEKPLGRDLDSARPLSSVAQSVLPESPIFRINHSLGPKPRALCATAQTGGRPFTNNVTGIINKHVSKKSPSICDVRLIQPY